MPYTLVKFALWFVLAAVVGFGIGWLLRSLRCRGEVAAARRSAASDDGELERLRAQLADLDEAVAERDRLKMKVADMRARDMPGVVGADVPPEPEGSDRNAGADDPIAGADRDQIDEQSSAVGDGTAPDSDDSDDGRIPGTDDEANDPAVDGEDEQVGGSVAEAVLDLAAARLAIGKKVMLDDLTVVEGIGPKISELCRGVGITTWQQLADADVATLRSMLDDAGSRYAIHDPTTWPEQADLLAAGRWEEFVGLTNRLDGGR